MEKNCTKCGENFECKADKIKSCYCYNIEISEIQLKKIQLLYEDCLCISCLKYCEKIR